MPTTSLRNTPKLNGTGQQPKNTTKVKDIIKGQYDNGLAKKLT
jgi:hypothetical protein